VSGLLVGPLILLELGGAGAMLLEVPLSVLANLFAALLSMLGPPALLRLAFLVEGD